MAEKNIPCIPLPFPLPLLSGALLKVRPPEEVTPTIGSTVRLPCVAENDLRTTITWTKDGKSSLPVDSMFYLLAHWFFKTSRNLTRDITPVERLMH